MKKRLLLFLFSMLTMVSAWADSFIVDGINYQTNWNDETTVSVVSNDPKYEGDIVIPASVTYEGKTYDVTSIGGSAFYDCSGLTSITIPDGVTSIGIYAFEGCSGLTSINIPDGVTSIGNSAFYGCSGLTRVDYSGAIVDWLKIKFSGYGSNPLHYVHHFYIDGNEVTEVVVPDGVMSIGDYAFDGCSSLTSITIPDGVTSIGEWAFNGCSGLTSITIPDGVTSIGNYAFYDCSGMTSINIPDGVTSIGNYAFVHCSSLTSITIPEGVTSIGAHSFSGCSGLTSITIPDGVTSIGNYAFNGCRSLTSITIPDGVTSIGGGAFSGCSSLTSITIPDGVTNIVWNAFYDCSGLTSISIPESVTSIGDYAFYGCSGLTSIVMKAKTPPTIGDNSFPSGKIIIVPDEALDDYAEAYGSDYIFSTEEGGIVCGKNWRYDRETKALSVYGDVSGEPWRQFSSEILKVDISDGVTSIGDGAFYGCSSLTSINIPDGVTSIGDYAFYGCSSLTSINIPDGVTSIGEIAFFGCSGLTSVTIGDGVTSIGNYAFGNCSKLKSITMKAKTPPTLGDNSISSGKLLIVPTESLDDYMEAYGSSYIYSTEDGKLVCGKDWRYNQETKTLSVLGNVSGQPWSQFRSEILNVEFSEGVTSIGSSAFSMCVGLTSVVMPESVTSIGSSAFYGCSGLTSVTIPDGVTSIGSRAFRDCSGLTSVTIPDGVASIGGSVFQGCESLTSIAIPKSVTEIGENIICGCTNITSVTVDEENEYFDSRNNCNAIIKKEGNVLLSGCKNTIIPEGVDSIGSRAFQDANGIKRIIIPEGVTGIGQYAFSDCKNVELVYLPSTIEYLEGPRAGYAFVVYNEELDIDECLCKDVYIAAIIPPVIRNSTFAATKENILHVPVGCKEAYEAAEYWSDFTIVEGLDLPDGIEEISIGKKLNKAIKTIDNGRVVIIVDGKKFDISGRKIE